MVQIEDIEKFNYKTIPLPDNATNGDIIKAIFPEVFVTNCKLVDKVGYFNFDTDWWNSPYKENIKDGNVD